MKHREVGAAQCRARRRGNRSARRAVALLLAMLAVIVASTTATMFLTQQSTSIGIARNIRQHPQARYIAETALDWIATYISTHTDWRAQLAPRNWQWVTNQAYGGGTFTITAQDGEDVNSDGLISNPTEGDSSLTDDGNDPVTLSIVSRFGGTSHHLKAVIRAVPGGKRVLMVVPNPASLSTAMEERRQLLQSLGNTVTSLAQTATQTQIDAALAEVDLAYIPNGTTIAAGAGQLNWATGIVCENPALLSALGFSASTTSNSSNSINIIDNTHYITEVFSRGAVQVAGSNHNMNNLSGSQAAAVQALAKRSAANQPALAVLETGDLLLGGSNGLRGSCYSLGFAPSVLADINFNATPTTTVTVANLNRSSGTSAGWSGGPADNFAIRYVSKLNIPSTGNWTFYIASDDGSALYINGALVVNNDGLHSMSTQSATIALTAGIHDFEVRVFERSGDYGLIANWRGPGVSSQTVIPSSAFNIGIAAGPRVHLPFGNVSSEQLTSDAKTLFQRAILHAGGGEAGQAGLNAAYYDIGSYLGSLADVNFSATPTTSLIVPNIDVPSTNDSAWNGGPADRFACRYTGKINIPQAGTWTFYTESDDGSALWINGSQIVDNDGLHGMTTRYASMALPAGLHTFEARVFENEGGFGMRVFWSGPGVPGQTIIPPSAFTTSGSSTGFTYVLDWR